MQSQGQGLRVPKGPDSPPGLDLYQPSILGQSVEAAAPLFPPMCDGSEITSSYGCSED